MHDLMAHAVQGVPYDYVVYTDCYCIQIVAYSRSLLLLHSGLCPASIAQQMFNLFTWGGCACVLLFLRVCLQLPCPATSPYRLTFPLPYSQCLQLSPVTAVTMQQVQWWGWW